MGLETFEFITSLNPNNPAGADPTSQGDDHIRGVKKALQDSFPAIDAPVLATPDDLNLIAGAATTGSGLNPTGTVILFAGDVAPNGYLPCDGAPIDVGFIDLIALVGVNTPDLRGQFVRGWSENADVDPDGPRAVLDPQAGEVGPHIHNLTVYDSGGSNAGKAQSTSGGAVNSDNTEANTGVETRPVNVTLMMVIKT